MVTCLLPLPSHRVLYFHQCGLLFLFCVSSLFILLNLPLSSAPCSFLSPLCPTRQSIGHNTLSHSWMPAWGRHFYLGA